MTNLENFIFESLKECALSYENYDKVDCLINHYEKNIEIYKNLVISEIVSSPDEILDNDYYNLNLICFRAEEKIDMEHIEKARDYYSNLGKSMMFIKDESSGDRYLYGFFNLDSFTKKDFIVKESEDERK